jgi:tetratricopeptide (TPR) repeat protein
VIEMLLEAERALDVGLLDQAERLFRQAAEGDPRNSIAVVGLARVALERGNDEDALALARRALEIDPENPAARRLVDRLVEVKAYREGVAPAVPAASPAPAASAASADRGAAAEQEPDVEPPAPATPAEQATERRRGILRRLFRR